MTPRSLAIAAAKAAGKRALAMAKRPIRYTMKGKYDIQAAADLACEKLILNKIRKNFPGHAIFSEEAGAHETGSRSRWIVDPIDGTINFSRGLDDWCVSIALERDGALVLGVIYQPVQDRLYVAEQGKGASCNGKRIRVSRAAKPIESVLTVDNTKHGNVRLQNFQLLTNICGEFRHIRMYGSAALALARIAEGKADAYYKTRLNYWDYAAAIVLLREAGGAVTDFSGAPLTEASPNILATNQRLHPAVQELIRRNLPPLKG